MGNDFGAVPINPNMLYDLRQTYAMQILTPILLNIESDRDNLKFENWFNDLTVSLYANIRQKLSEEERKEYLEEKKETIKIINKYPGVYRGNDKSFKESYLLKEAILNLEMWLKDKMEEKGLFGKGGDYDWDEI